MVTHCFHDTDDPTNIYGNLGKLCQILSATLTIQRTYMVDLGYYRELSCYARTYMICFRVLSHILVKWRSNKTIASVGLAQAHPNYSWDRIIKSVECNILHILPTERLYVTNQQCNNFMWQLICCVCTVESLNNGHFETGFFAVI